MFCTGCCNFSHFHVRLVVFRFCIATGCRLFLIFIFGCRIVWFLLLYGGFDALFLIRGRPEAFSSYRHFGILASSTNSLHFWVSPASTSSFTANNSPVCIINYSSASHSDSNFIYFSSYMYSFTSVSVVFTAFSKRDFFKSTGCYNFICHYHRIDWLYCPFICICAGIFTLGAFGEGCFSHMVGFFVYNSHFGWSYLLE